MILHRRVSLCLLPIVASIPLLTGACSSSEDAGGGDGDGGQVGDGDTGTGGAGSGGDGNLTTGGAPAGTGGDAAGTGGESSGTGGEGSGGTGGESSGTGGEGSGTGGESSGTGGEGSTACPNDMEEKFSFFATSHAALIRESGNPDGFGGDLGGLAGADAICQSIAEYSSPCQSNKTWRAFLSTSTEDAIDRIGTGPWHDRVGRLLANDLSELVDGDRPPNADPEIRNDFPNEDGVQNQFPDGEEMVDNHQFITGSGEDGRLYAVNDGIGSMCADGFSIAAATCNDWTTSEEVGCPRVGHSWLRPNGGLDNWISVWNEGGCAPGGVLEDIGGPDGSRRIGSAGGYGGFYCFAVTGQ